MGSAKKKNIRATTKRAGARKGSKEYEKETPTGPLTLDELIEVHCPKVEFENEEVNTYSNHPILGGSLVWTPTPFGSHEPIRQLYYVIITATGDIAQSDRIEMMQHLEAHHFIRNLTAKSLVSLSKHMDINLIIINANRFHVVTPEPHVYNTSRLTVLTYHDGESYYRIDEPEYILEKLMKTGGKEFHQIVRFDKYGNNK